MTRQYSYGFDNTKFICVSKFEVKETVYVVFILVIIIIFLLLRHWRETRANLYRDSRFAYRTISS